MLERAAGDPGPGCCVRGGAPSSTVSGEPLLPEPWCGEEVRPARRRSVAGEPREGGGSVEEKTLARGRGSVTMGEPYAPPAGAPRREERPGEKPLA